MASSKHDSQRTNMVARTTFMITRRTVLQAGSPSHQAVMARASNSLGQTQTAELIVNPAPDITTTSRRP
jgi:hypothetical protein